jgi:hypothetical protein
MQENCFYKNDSIKICIETEFLVLTSKIKNVKFFDKFISFLFLLETKIFYIILSLFVSFKFVTILNGNFLFFFINFEKVTFFFY